MDQEEFDQRAKEHAKWVASDYDKGRRLDLRGEDLRDLDLSDKDLRHCRLQDCNLAGAILNKANLQQSYLQGTRLTGVECIRANLTLADLSRAVICQADMSSSDMRAAGLEDAVVRHANFTNVDFRDVNLSGASLAVLHLGKWQTVVQANDITVYGWQYPVDRWNAFKTSELRRMAHDMPMWWKTHKDVINAVVGIVQNNYKTLTVGSIWP